MPQTPRLFRAPAAPVPADEYPEEYLSLLRQDGPTPSCIFAEDLNMGDEAFAYLREDPEFLALIVR